MKEKKYDLFAFFDAMNRGRFSDIDKMTDEEVKSLSGFVLLMWCHGAKSATENHVIMTDWYCNDMVFSLSRHPRLLLKLFVAANCDMGSTRYGFIKSVTREESSVIKMVAKHYECGYNEAKDYVRILRKEDLNELKEIYGEIK